MDKAEEKSIEWQKANHPMAIGGGNFADMVDSYNVNPAYVAGYKEAEKDLALTWEDISTIIRLYNNAMSSPSVIQWGFGSDIHCQIVLDEFNKRRNTLQNDT